MESDSRLPCIVDVANTAVQLLLTIRNDSTGKKLLKSCRNMLSSIRKLDSQASIRCVIKACQDSLSDETVALLGEKARACLSGFITTLDWTEYMANNKADPLAPAWTTVTATLKNKRGTQDASFVWTPESTQQTPPSHSDLSSVLLINVDGLRTSIDELIDTLVKYRPAVAFVLELKMSKDKLMTARRRRPTIHITKNRISLDRRYDMHARFDRLR